jgi:Mrp family chromosome partitioning ATPase
MRQKLETSEAAVQQFQHDAGLIEAAGTTMTGQQLVELNSQLIAARLERAQAESRMRMATELARTGGGGSDLSDVLGSKAVQTLREQLYEVQTKLDEQRNHWRGRLQASSTTTLEAQKASLTRQINEEIARVVASLTNEARAAREKEAELEAALQALESQFGKSGINVAHLNQLQREADANRTIYESFLKRYKETIEQAELATPDARLISLAQPPGAPAGPKRLPILILGFVGGAGISAALALLRERLDNRVRRASELEEMTGAPVVGVLLRGNKGRIASKKELRSRSRSGLPCSQVSDALHQVQVALHLSRGGGSGPKVIMVVAATLDESKAGFSSSLACTLASNGLRVLVIDIDGHQSDPGTLRDDKVLGSLTDVVDGRLSLEEAVSIDPVSGVHALRGMGKPLRDRLQLDLIGFRTVMNRARVDYDAVIVDASTVADAAVVGSLTDANLLLVRWGMTSRDAIRSALRFLRLCDVPIDGVILTDVDLRWYAQYNEIGDNAPTFRPRSASATAPVSPPSTVSPPSIIERAHARSRSAAFSNNFLRSTESRAERDLPR